MLSIAQIQENSKQLRGLHDRIGEMFRDRDRGPEQRAHWEAVCAEFHRRFDNLCFPGGVAVFDKVKTGDAEAIESAIRFLLADPRHFRSGYIKEYLWRMVPRHPLSASDIERLEGAALAYLKRQISREFWYMCRAMARIGTNSFWQDVLSITNVDDALVAKRASYLLAFSHSVQLGEGSTAGL